MPYCQVCLVTVKLSVLVSASVNLDVKAISIGRSGTIYVNISDVLTGSSWLRPIVTHPSVYGEPLISYLAEVVYQLILLLQLKTSVDTLNKRLQPSKRPPPAPLPQSSQLLISQVPSFLVSSPSVQLFVDVIRHC